VKSTAACTSREVRPASNPNPNVLPRKPSAEQTRLLDLVLATVPNVDAESTEALRLSLLRYGQLAPLIRRRGVLVDGRRRLPLLNSLKIEPWIVDLNDGAGSTLLPNAPDLLGRSYAELNGCRRELPLAVRAAIADALATCRKGDNQHSAPTAMSREEAAKTVGVSADTIDRFRRVQAVPRVCERVLTGKLSLPQAVREIEATQLAKKAKTLINAKRDLSLDIDDIARRGQRFSVVYADPAWDYGQTKAPTSSVAPHIHYPVMSTEAIKALPVASIAAKDAVLWLWVPNCLLLDGLEVVKAWGFAYVTTSVWVKPYAPPTPGSVRPRHETLIVAKRGAGLAFKGAPSVSVFDGKIPKGAHSKKPDFFADEIDRLYPNTARVELFCRQARRGWVALGNQCATAATVASARKKR
jgi:N6-adenosine-specific RNA methylase IME4